MCCVLSLFSNTIGFMVVFFTFVFFFAVFAAAFNVVLVENLILIGKISFELEKVLLTLLFKGRRN